jgi:hypothetical protein
MKKKPPFGAVSLGLALVLGAGCSDGAGDQQAKTLPSTCTLPAAPAAVGYANPVGDGTAASCTEEALRAAAAEGGDISFSCGDAPVTIAVGAEIEVLGNAVVDGAGLVTLDGQNATRILSSVQESSLAVVGLTFTRGYAAGDDGYGGALRGGWRGKLHIRDCAFTDNRADQLGGAVFIESDGEMTIVGSAFTGNQAPYGGAIHNMLSGLTVVNTIFSSNASTSEGGGALATDGASGEIDDAEGGIISLCGCVFEDNQGVGEGGGAYLFAYPPDELRVNLCLFENNSIVATDGGALGGGLRTGNATLVLANSTFVGNHADTHGGGMWVDGSYTAYVTNCTFAGNDAGREDLEGGYGGAISGGNLVMTNLTLEGNTAQASGGAIFNEDQSSVLRNSVLVNNAAANEWGIALTCREPMDGTDNLQWPDQGEAELCTGGTSYANPLLGDLADNGGETPTMALDAGSPALEAADAFCPETDQRGEPRDEPCDLGAFESE